MNALNSIIVEGNVSQDPVCRETSKGTALCHFSVAVNRYFKKDSGIEKEVSFFDVETWGQLAKSCEVHVHKGRGVRVVGRLKQERWIDTNGKNCAKVVILAEHVEFKPETKKDDESEEAPVPEDIGEEEPLAVNW
jgi:single-strand DNA-binding protein